MRVFVIVSYESEHGVLTTKVRGSYEQAEFHVKKQMRFDSESLGAEWCEFPENHWVDQFVEHPHVE